MKYDTNKLSNISFYEKIEKILNALNKSYLILHNLYPVYVNQNNSIFRYKNNEVRRGCILVWPDGEMGNSMQDHM